MAQLLEWSNLGDNDDSELNLHHEFNPSSMKIGSNHGKTLLDYITSINNPFGYGIRLQSITTGIDIPPRKLLYILNLVRRVIKNWLKPDFKKRKNINMILSLPITILFF